MTTSLARGAGWRVLTIGLLALAGGGARAAWAQANTDTVAFSETFFSACLGEVLVCEGSTLIVNLQQADEGDGLHASLHQRTTAQCVSESGIRCHVQDNGNLSEQLHEVEDGARTFTGVSFLRLICAGRDNDVGFRVLSHITFNSNDELVSQKLEFGSESCR